MAEGTTPSLLMSIIPSIAFGLTAIYVAVMRRHRPTWLAGVVLLLACAELTLAHAMGSISSDFATKVFWYKMVYVGFMISPTAFLCLALRYGGLDRVLTHRTRLLLSVFPGLSAGLIFTNEFHGLMWNPASTEAIVYSMRFLSADDARIWYWLLAAYSYSALGIGCFFLVRLLARSRGIYGWQASGIVMAAVLAILGSVLDVFWLSPFEPFVATTLGLTVGSITVALALSPLRRRDLLSVSRGTIMNSIGDGIVVLDDGDWIVDMNPAAERLVGKPARWAIGKPVEQLSPELKLALSHADHESSETAMTREGNLLTFDLRVSAIRDSQKRVISRVIVLRDITERKQAEQALREAERKYRILVERLPVVVYTSELGANGVWRYVSPQLEDLLGFTPDEATTDPGLWHRQIHPDDFERQAALEAQAYEKGEPFEGEYRIFRRDGREIWVRDSAHVLPTHSGGTPIVQGVLMDITERVRAEEALRKSEERFRALIENSADAITLIDARGIPLYDSPSVPGILGYRPKERVGQTIFELIHADDLHRIRDLFENLVKTPGAHGNSIFRLRHKSGLWVWIEAVAANLLAEPSVKAIVVNYRDITKRKQAEQALQAATADLARSNRELQQFAYVASHDLQEPLRMVASYLQLLHQKYAGRLGVDADEFIAFAVDGAKRMQALINDLLAYSRVGTRGAPFQRVDCACVLDRVLADLQVAIQEGRANICRDPLPAVWGDEVQLGQLFQNLIGNAIKFRSHRSPEVCVGVNRQDGHWLFRIQDNGIGIEPEYWERIFLIFQRLHAREEYPGTGVGLAICQRIVERHGGQIWLESKPGEGATFYFTLPAMVEAAP